MDDNEDEVLHVDAASQLDGLPSYRELLNTTLRIIAHLNPGAGAPLLSRSISLDALLPVSESALELVDAPCALKEVIYFQDHLPEAAVAEVATGFYYIGDDDDDEDDKELAVSADFTAFAEHLDRIDTDNDLIILGNIVIEKRISALEALAEAGASGGKEVLEEVDAISYNIGNILQGNLILRQYCFPGANGFKPAFWDLQDFSQ